MLPIPAGVRLQVTLVFAVPVTDAVNCRVPAGPSVNVLGDTVTEIGGGFNVTVDSAHFVLSATLVALTVTICCVAILAGAVYNPPALRLPTPAGVRVQFTAVFAVPETDAANCCVPFASRATAVGLIET